MDDEALKKSTDCVYFLASPLTCKKGSECEFRHSEIARINPRDCRFWLSTGCLNRECPFRHPPLDGRAVTQSVPLTSKVKVPCYYYSQGYCAKGDFCAFMHGAPSAPNFAISAQQKISKATDADLKTDGIPETSDVSNGIIPKVPSRSKETVVSETIASRVVKPRQVDRTASDLLQVPLSSQHIEAEDSGDNGRTAEGALSPAPPSSKWHVQPAEPSDERVQSGAEAEDNWKESSPGFDVLVDDGPDQLLYYADGHFLSEHDAVLDSGQGLPLSHGGRGMHSIEDFETFEYEYLSGYDQPYTSTGHFDHGIYDVYEETLDYQHYDPYDEMLDHRAVYPDGLSDDYVHNRIEYLVKGEDHETAPLDDFRRFHPKRRRVGERSFSDGNNPRRRHADISSDEFQQRGWQDSDRQHMFAQQSGRANNRRVHDKSVAETARKGRRPLHDVGSEGAVPYERFVSKISQKGRAAKDRARLGPRKHDRMRMPKTSNLSFTSEHGVFKFPTEVRNPEENRHTSDFVGPKSLAQLKAEKRKGENDEEDLTIVTNENAGTHEKIGSLGGVFLKSGRQMASAYSSEPKGTKQEKKIVLAKITCESKAMTTFEGPKPLRALLEAKRGAEKGNKVQVDSLRKGSEEPSIANKAISENAAKPASTSTADDVSRFAREGKGLTKETKGTEMNKCDIHERDQEPAYSKVKRMDWSFEEESGQVSTSHTNKYQGLNSTVASREIPALAESTGNEELEQNEEEEAAAEYDEDDEFAKTLGGLFS
ncbi:hypothetical protein O6H91_19G058900 [Diphasiastrum complanatum]|uniref:Uncharacterized protein n=1 Tax=Diphasiastrum complanatum TaxID=34168 RepID=A0ACC2AVK5_DIPCM|nr:hypothetical protein O6H91_19G058900 [Diphasiastrum complanatum]